MQRAYVIYDITSLSEEFCINDICIKLFNDFKETTEMRRIYNLVLSDGQLYNDIM